MLDAGEPFIANSISLDPVTRQIMIITGPNMAGKSVVLRQTGLIVLLAQVGSFVPAEKASIGLVDRIFTRVGASDNLASGESTFLVEMNEAANILNNATPESLVLLDEVGRGTSTFDGLSIAWALVEYLHEYSRVAAQTLFATHYHELNELSDRYERIVNFRVQVKEHNGKVVFLRKLVPGGADHSYGIEVARMAGLPQPLIERAQQILMHLESQQLQMYDSDGPRESATGKEAKGEEHTSNEGTSMPSKKDRTTGFQELPDVQLSLFQPVDAAAQEAAELLRELDPNSLTPVEALLRLVELKRIVDR
jgi:DNA mismatch repair protein MutS